LLRGAHEVSPSREAAFAAFAVLGTPKMLVSLEQEFA
jgi:hypothetical protein